MNSSSNSVESRLNADLARAREISKNDIKKSVDIANKVSRKALELNLKPQLAGAYRILGNNYSAQSRLPKSIEYYNESLRIYTELNDRAGTAMVYNNLGIANFKMFKYTEAIDFYFKALKIKEDIKDQKGILSTLINIGAIYQRQANYKEAITFYKKAASAAKKHGEKGLMAASLQNMGETLIEQKKYTHALRVLKSASEIFVQTKNFVDLVSAYINMGIVCRRMKRYKEELEMYEAGGKIAEEQHLTQELGVCYQNIGEALLRQKKLDEAHAVLKSAVNLLEKAASHPSRTVVYNLLAKLYKARGNYKEALKNEEKYAAEVAKIYTKDRSHQINEIHMRYEVEKREKEAEIFRLRNVELKSALKSLDAEKKRSDLLLKNILPEQVAEDLKTKGKSEVQYFAHVSVMFIDIKNFTIHTEKTEPAKLVERLGIYFTTFEEIISKYRIEKIKTIGDAFLCVSGLPKPDKKHALKTIAAAREIILFAKKQQEQFGDAAFEIRIGVHSGPVIAGIIGTQKFAYDIWGDTVNTAARMEQSGEVGKINISNSTYSLIRRQVKCSYRGKLPAKNKGDIDMYFVESN